MRIRIQNLVQLVASFLTIAQFFSNTSSALADSISNADLISLSKPTSIGSSSATNSLVKQSEDTERKILISGVTINASSFGGDETRRLAKENVIIGPESINNHIHLISGNVLLNLEKDIVVHAPEANIQVGNGSKAFIVKNTDSLAIYNLHQIKPKQIAITCNMQKFIIEPGQLLVLTKKNTVDFKTLGVDYHQIIQGNPKCGKSDNNTLHAFVAEFSIVSALVSIAPLERLLESNNAQDKKFLATLIRDAIILGEGITELEIASK